jgi:uncharacterized protein YecE (DUF72 family)
MDPKRSKIYVGTAGWAIRREDAHFFPVDGSHLERYSDVFNLVEINSSFYRDHRPATYRRWAEDVPDDFRFSVKLSRSFTHELRMAETGARLRESLGGIRELGEKAGALLIQLPPSLELSPKIARAFFAAVREHWPYALACEPRHKSWSSQVAAEIFSDHAVAKVLADPERCVLEQAFPASAYYRLHGTPKIYKSAYDSEMLDVWSSRIVESAESGAPVFCVFDNTAIGNSVPNALELKKILAPIALSASPSIIPSELFSF